MEIGWQTKEEDGQVVRGGKYFFLVDEGFQVVFRAAHGQVVRAVFLALGLAVVATTVVLVLQEGGEGALVWLVASCFALATLIVLYLVRNALDTGPVVVDGSLRTIWLPKGMEIPFDRIHSVDTGRKGAHPTVRLLLDDGELRLVQRRGGDGEAREAAEAIKRLLAS